jgi:hypothetical protein
MAETFEIEQSSSHVRSLCLYLINYLLPLAVFKLDIAGGESKAWGVDSLMGQFTWSTILPQPTGLSDERTILKICCTNVKPRQAKFYSRL